VAEECLHLFTAIKTNGEIDLNDKYTWAIEDIYKSVEDWETEYNAVIKEIDFDDFKGKLGEKSEFLACMKKQEKLGRIIEKLGVYAMMQHDGDTRDSLFDSLNAKMGSLYSIFGMKSSFVGPELTSLKEETLKNYIEDPDLKEYDYSLKCVLKEKAHVLSENEESLLASLGETTSSFKDIFTKIDNADLPLNPFKYKGKTVEMSHAGYGVAMHSPDRNFRKSYFKNYYKAYESLLNTITATYFGNVKKDVFYAKAKKYDGALDRALKGEDVDKKVYDNLIKSVNKALPLLHRYIRDKKKLLGLKTMRMYDIYVPTETDVEIKLPFDTAYDLVVEGLSVLGDEYVSLLKKAKDERWIDVYEKQGKRSGAYSVAVYDTHPYVLLNYKETTNNVFTIAHEMGHSIHSYFSNRVQPYQKADYKIFVAEVASTVNEVLLIRYLLGKEQDKKVKKYLLSYLLEMIRTTLFRQTQFSEFEEFAHSTYEKGEPLTKDNLSSKYFEINKKYYGRAIKYDDEIKYEWARIPHFYRAFYVYKYATGIISALAIADRILTEGKPAIDDYFKFLSSGGSDGPVELLKIAGVDLTTKTPFIRAFERFKSALIEFESL